MSSFFSEKADTKLLDDIMSNGQKTIIQELEMMAVLAALRAWKERVSACRVVFLLTVRQCEAFLKSWSANEDSIKLINLIFQTEKKFDLPVWIERVPSQSNPSDILSWEEVTKFEEAQKVELDLRKLWKLTTKGVDE